MQKCIFSIMVSVLLFLLLAAPSGLYASWGVRASQGQTIVVNSLADSGAGTLRQALLDAQAEDQITFDPMVFPPTSPLTTSFQSGLPAITEDGLTVDGSQAGVILHGRQRNPSNGLTIRDATGVTIQGLQIVNFMVGIELRQGAQNVLIGGDREEGTGPLGQGNLISGNFAAGIKLRDAETSGNQIQGNYIGTDLSGNVRQGIQT